jgi:serine/threonine-protein kinase HipA
VADLIVELYGKQVGRLVRKDWRTFDFRTDSAAFESFQLGSTVMSESTPLEAIANRSRAARRQNFFAELLPEGDMLDAFAAEVGKGTSTKDVIALLTRFGGDVAGAIQIYDPEQPGEPRTPQAAPISRDDVGNLLRNVRQAPLGNRPIRGKSSLAGVQDKIVLARIGQQWNQALDGFPSTHIIKSFSDRHPTVIFDEEYGARIAKAVGLTDYETRIDEFGGTPGLVIERYDRDPEAADGRVHQEDAGQALGISRAEKYQEHGGRVSLSRVAGIFGAYGDADSLRRLLTMTALSVAVGNFDLHAKNISLLHLSDESMTLAPAYDVVPQAHEDNDGRMAMAINRKYDHRHITLDDIAAEGSSWGVTDARSIVESALDTVLAFASDSFPDPRAYTKVRDDIIRFTTNLIEGRGSAEDSPRGGAQS